MEENVLLARQVPQALEAEQSVLGAMMIDSRCVPAVIGALRPEDAPVLARTLKEAWRPTA